MVTKRELEWEGAHRLVCTNPQNRYLLPAPTCTARDRCEGMQRLHSRPGAGPGRQGPFWASHCWDRDGPVNRVGCSNIVGGGRMWLHYKIP